MNRYLSFGSLAMALVLLAADSVAGRERPHVTTAAGHFVNANDYVAEGWETHLGHFTDVGSAQFLPTDEPNVFDVEAWGVHTADNGDQLFTLVHGQANLLTGEGIALVHYVGGTGRFANADGWAIATVQLYPDGTFEIFAIGYINF